MTTTLTRAPEMAGFTLGEKLRLLRTMLNWSIEKCAAKSDTEPEIWARWEDDEILPRDRHLKAFATSALLTPSTLRELMAHVAPEDVPAPVRTPVPPGQASESRTDSWPKPLTARRPATPSGTTPPPRPRPASAGERPWMGAVATIDVSGGTMTGKAAEALPDPPTVADAPVERAPEIPDDYELVTPVRSSRCEVVIRLTPTMTRLRLTKVARLILGADVGRIRIYIRKDDASLLLLPAAPGDAGDTTRGINGNQEVTVSFLRDRLVLAGWASGTYAATRSPNGNGIVIDRENRTGDLPSRKRKERPTHAG